MSGHTRNIRPASSSPASQSIDPEYGMKPSIPAPDTSPERLLNIAAIPTTSIARHATA